MDSDLPLAGLHVLVVEDMVVLAFELVDQLEACGAVPLGPIPTVIRALQVIETSKRIDAALLDVMLCGKASFPVAEELRRRGIPFVFVTGDDEAVGDRFPDVPVHSKPADMAEVVMSLAAVVATRALLS